MPPRTPLSGGGNSCFHTPACVPARSVDWENRVGSKHSNGVKTITRLRRVLCPATPDAYFNWIPASLHLFVSPAFGGNDETGAARMTLFVFRHCSAYPSCSAALEYNWPAIPGDNSSFLQKHPTPSSRQRRELNMSSRPATRASRIITIR